MVGMDVAGEDVDRLVGRGHERGRIGVGRIGPEIDDDDGSGRGN